MSSGPVIVCIFIGEVADSADWVDWVTCHVARECLKWQAHVRLSSLFKVQYVPMIREGLSQLENLLLLYIIV